MIFFETIFGVCLFFCDGCRRGVWSARLFRSDDEKVVSTCWIGVVSETPWLLRH